MKNKLFKYANYAEIEIKNKDNVFYCKVDKEDIECLEKHSWYLINGYVACKIKGSNFYIHRFLLNPPVNMQIDHKNGNPLDNRRSNLKICTQQENLRNKTKSHKIGSNLLIPSKTKFVYKNGNKWRAIITYGNTQLNLGNFNTIEEAKLMVKNSLNNLVMSY